MLFRLLRKMHGVHYSRLFETIGYQILFHPAWKRDVFPCPASLCLKMLCVYSVSQELVPTVSTELCQRKVGVTGGSSLHWGCTSLELFM